MITFTDQAVKAVRRFIRYSDTPDAALRLKITGGGCSGLSYEMSLEQQPGDQDTVLQAGQFSVLVDADSLPLLDGMTVDFEESMASTGFVFNNPNASGSCGCGKSFSA